MQEIAGVIDYWKYYLSEHSRVQLEEQGRRYWADASLMLAQRFFSDDDIDTCTSQLRAAKKLYNHGRYRSVRLRLEGKVLLRRAFGQRVISAMRKLRRQVLPR
jgi:hypothetical protein